VAEVIESQANMQTIYIVPKPTKESRAKYAPEPTRGILFHFFLFNRPSFLQLFHSEQGSQRKTSENNWSRFLTGQIPFLLSNQQCQ